MSYIGNGPIVGAFKKCDALSASGTATYNLTVSSVAVLPQSANHCIVSLNGVIQSPTSAFTVSGSTIVFNSSLTTSDTIDFILILGDVLNIGKPSADAVTSAEIADDAVNSEHYVDGSIDTAHIADDQVTLAKMAAGTDGNVISYDASGNPVAIATGSDGQVLTSTGAGSPPAFETVSAGFTLGSPTATTSGTDIAFTSIPAGTKVIYINFNEVSLSGTDDYLVQIGDSGGVETSAYFSHGGKLYDSSSSVGWESQTAGALLKISNAGYGLNGTCTLRLVDSSNYIWSMNFQGHLTTAEAQAYVINHTQKTLSAELDRINITTDGSNTFDAGKISIMYI
jgi:hypothetical protein